MTCSTPFGDIDEFTQVKDILVDRKCSESASHWPDRCRLTVLNAFRRH